MRFVIHLLVMFAVALTVGFGLSWYALTDGRFLGTLASGPWVAWPDAGAPSPNPYTRAQITRSGTLQLGQGEGLAFLATTDSAGVPLTRACTYRIEGRTPLASLWTLFALDPEGMLIGREGSSGVLRSNGLVRAADGSVTIFAGPRLSPLNWLELPGEGPFTLHLTLYDTMVSSGLGVSVDTMPAILREACP